jgi:glycosyl transferase family 9 (putative heptosyltransferase)
MLLGISVTAWEYTSRMERTNRMDRHYRMSKCSHLGDVWARINTALRLSEIAPLYFSCRSGNCYPVVNQVLDLLDMGSAYFRVVRQQPANAQSLNAFIDSPESYKTVYFPTKTRHSCGEATKTIAYSFDAQWHADEKIPPKLDDVLRALSAELPDYCHVRVGLPMSLRDIVETLAAAQLVLSVDNGIAHVARSVSVPLFLIEHLLPVERGFPPNSCFYTKVNHGNIVDAVVNFIHGLQAGAKQPS